MRFGTASKRGAVSGDTERSTVCLYATYHLCTRHAPVHYIQQYTRRFIRRC